MEKFHPPLYTQENVVYGPGIEKADTTVPVWVLRDDSGNHALTDGNHRAYRAYLDGNLDLLPRRIIGTFPGDVSQDPDYRPISALRVRQTPKINL